MLDDAPSILVQQPDVGNQGVEIDSQSMTHEGSFYTVTVARRKGSYQMSGASGFSPENIIIHPWFSSQFRYVPHPALPPDVRRRWLHHRLDILDHVPELEDLERDDPFRMFIVKACTESVLADSFFRFR